jgi:hypothetical protein
VQKGLSCEIFSPCRLIQVCTAVVNRSLLALREAERSAALWSFAIDFRVAQYGWQAVDCRQDDFVS